MSQPQAPVAPATTQATAATQPQGQAGQPKGVEAPKSGTATPAEIKKMKLILDGKNVEMTESEVIAMAQKASSADKRFMEAANMRKQAEQVLEFATKNPKEFFAKTGLNARQWAEEYLISELKAEAMSPEQRKAVENEEKLKRFEAEKKSADERAKKEQDDRLSAHHAENYNKLFVEALAKSGLPKTPYTIKRMAELQLVNLKKKLDLNADQLAKVVKEDYGSEHKSLLGGMNGDELMQFLGPDLVKKLSKAQIAQLKAKGVKAASGPAKSRSGDKPSISSWREYQLRNRGRA